MISVVHDLNGIWSRNQIGMTVTLSYVSQYLIIAVSSTGMIVILDPFKTVLIRITVHEQQSLPSPKFWSGFRKEPWNGIPFGSLSSPSTIKWADSDMLGVPREGGREGGRAECGACFRSRKWAALPRLRCSQWPCPSASALPSLQSIRLVAWVKCLESRLSSL